MGGGGFGGGAPVATAPQPRASAAGVRPIRIEVPRTGQSFNFTKVLNTSQEPLTASFSMMRLKVYRGVQMVIQASAFVLGLLPLVTAHGAAMLSRRSVGMPVFAGMIAASSIGIFIIPMLYVTFQSLREGAKARFGRQPK